VNNTTYYYSTDFNEKLGLGVVSLIPDMEIQQTITKFKILSIFGLVGTFLITFFLSLILSQKLITPLKGLTNKILLVKEGNLDISTKMEKSDEIGDLANSFDKMRLNLKESFNKLNLFISDLKLINKSSSTILTSRSIGDLSKSYLTQIATVFNSDYVSISISEPELFFDWAIQGYFKKIEIKNDLHKASLYGNEFSTVITIPILIKENLTVIINIIKNKPNYYIYERIETAEILSSQYIVGLEALRLYEEEQNKRLIQHDLQNAKIIQNAIFPIDHFTNDFSVLITITNLPTNLSGDWLNFYKMDNNELQFLVGDVTGHGVAASLLTSTVHTFFNIQSRGLIPELINDLPKTLQELNSIVCQSKDHLNMTLLLAKLNFEKKNIEICNAGHNHAILFRRNANGDIKTVSLSNLNTRIGEFGSEFSSTNYDIESGDKILFYTDGIIEWNNENGREWGKKNLVKMISKNIDLNNKNIIKTVLSHLDSHMINRNSMDDDLTISLVSIL